MTSRDLPGLQVLRGLAAVMVLIGHVLAEAEHYLRLDLPGDAIPWTRGVDLFFVISGCVVTLSAHRFIGQPAVFLTRRVLRIAPLYFLFTTLMVLVLLVFPGGPKDTSLDFGQILTSYTFVPYARDDGRIAPVLSLGWTLNYEVFFYCALAVCLLLGRPFLALACSLTGLALIGMMVRPEQTQVAFWTNPLILEFLFGVGLGKLWLAGWHRPNWVATALGTLAGLALLVILDPMPLPRFIAAGLPALLIVASGTLFCPARPLPGMIWGDASYALYLSHRFTLRAATLLFLPVLPATHSGGLVYVALVSMAALCVGLIIHLWWEKPVMRAFDQSAGRKVAA